MPQLSFRFRKTHPAFVCSSGVSGWQLTCRIAQHKQSKKLEKNRKFRTWFIC